MANEENLLPSVQDFSAPIDEAEAPKPLPKGNYIGEVVLSQFQVSKSSGNPTLKVRFKIDAARYPHDFVGPQDGVTIDKYFGAADNDWNRYKLKELFDALGRQLPKTRVDAADLLGRTALIEVDHEEFNGRMKETIKSVKKGV